MRNQKEHEMRIVFGVLSLLIAVTVVGVLLKKQLAALSGMDAAPGASTNVSLPVAAPQQRSRQLQNQVKKSVEDAMKQTRPEVDDK